MSFTTSTEGVIDRWIVRVARSSAQEQPWRLHEFVHHDDPSGSAPLPLGARDFITVCASLRRTPRLRLPSASASRRHSCCLRGDEFESAPPRALGDRMEIWPQARTSPTCFFFVLVCVVFFRFFVVCVGCVCFFLFLF